jgi:hypothetical protein
LKTSLYGSTAKKVSTLRVGKPSRLTFRAPEAEE